MSQHSSHRSQPATGSEAGFTILESTIALGLVFIVLVGLLTTVATSVRSIVTSKQRDTAVSIADRVMEQARGLGYNEVGHDLDDDATGLDADPALTSTGTPGEWTFTPCATCSPERLVGSSIDWAAATAADSPFYPHQRTLVEGDTQYTVRAYVTQVVPVSGAPHKRITVVVDWIKGQYEGGIDSQVRLESLMFEAVTPPDPLLLGASDIDAGVLSLSGYFANLDLQDGFLWMPYSHGEIDSQFIRRVSGFAAGSRSQLNLNKALTSDELSGCLVVNSSKTAECRGVKATTVADNDQGTAPGEHDLDGPLNGAAGTIERKNVLSIALGTSTAVARSSSAACGGSCPSPHLFTESDALPYHESEAEAAAGHQVSFSTGTLSGNLLASTGDIVRARSTLDRDDTASGGTVMASGTVQHPAFKLITFGQTIYDLTGLTILPVDGFVRVSPASASATVYAGPGVSAPVVSGGDVTVELYDTTLIPGYQTFTFTPGVEASATARAEVLVAGHNVTVETTVSTSKIVQDTEVTGSTYTSAMVSLTNWLTVRSRLYITSGSTVVADLVTDLDYGRVFVSAEYEAAP